jgi:hypothetical protein
VSIPCIGGCRDFYNRVMDPTYLTVRHTIYCINIEVGPNKYHLRKRYTEFLMLHQVRLTRASLMQI